MFAAFAPFVGFGDSIPETAPQGVVHEENGADTGFIPATSDSTENSSCRGQRLDEAENLCFVRAILHLPDEESRPSVSDICSPLDTSGDFHPQYLAALFHDLHPCKAFSRCPFPLPLPQRFALP